MPNIIGGENMLLGKKGFLKSLSFFLALTVCITGFNVSAFAYTMTYNFTTPKDPGYPTFSGNGAPAEPVSYTTNNMIQAIYDSEKNGTSFWMDRMLVQTGNNPDTNDLFSRGRMLLLKSHNPSVLGFSGGAHYGDVVDDNKSIYTVTVTPGTLTENVSARGNYPSYWASEYNTSSSINVKETKFITNNNVAVTLLTIKNNSSSSKNVVVTANSPFATTASGTELTGTVASPMMWKEYNASQYPYVDGLTTASVYLSGDGMSVSGSNITRTITLAAGATTQAKIQLGWTTKELPESTSEYTAYKGYSNDTAFSTHVKTYNQWWADNIPYIDVPDTYIKKILYYRWWLNRFNSIDGNIPGNDWQFPAPVEGALGYANQITVSLPWIMDDIKYLRNPIYDYGTFLTAGETAETGAYRDNPARRWMWNKLMMQYISKAGWEGYKVHGGPVTILNNFSKYAENDINGQLAAYDQNNNKLLAYADSTITGNDGCLPSMQYFSTNGYERNSERIDASAYNYGNVIAAAQMYNYMGNTSKAAEFNTLANTIQTNFMNYFWDEPTKQFLHYDVAAGQRELWKDNNFNGYWMGIIPTTDTKYREMFKLFNNSGDYFTFPFLTGDYNDITARYTKLKSTGQFNTWYANTFGFCNGGVNLSVLSSALKKYTNSYITADTYKKTLYWDAWLHCIQDGNANYLDANEFFWLENTNSDTKVTTDMQQTGKIVRSWIHHNLLSKMNSNVIEDVFGFTPREDKLVELFPVDIGWDHFTINGIRYHDSDITIVWDKPGDGKTYYGSVPEGYSLYVNGTRMFTIDNLKHVIWDSQTGALTFPEGGATASYNVSNTAFKEAKDVTFTDSRVLDIFQKAGRDISSATEPTNLAQNAAKTGYPTPSASYTASGKDVWGAVDGYTVDNTLWGTKGSSNAQDWLQIDFGSAKTLDTIKLYFYNDRCNSGYSEPSSYTIQYLNGSTWTDVAGQAKSPNVPQANYNRATFTPVTAQKIRVLVTHKSGFNTGIKEIQVFNTGGGTAVNTAPVVDAGTDSTVALPAKIQLTGTANDDGLPNGTLSTTWSLVSGAGTAVITDPSALITTATVTVPGSYQFKLTASDGALTSSDTVTVTVNAAGTLTNIASLATSSTSYCSPWETITALNDGFDPSSSNDRTQAVYGNWDNKGTTQWVQYDFSQPYTISRSDVYWFKDSEASAGGVCTPASCAYKYWDGNAWVAVTNPVGLGIAADTYNTTTFTPITTTKIRLEMTAQSTASTGIEEWKVYGVPAS